MISVYNVPSPRFGRGIQRVARAIQQFAPPEVTFTTDPERCDLHIHHVIGVQNFHETHTIDNLIGGSPKRRHAVLQYCLRTTENPDLIWWDNNVWSQAKVTWSYYDLQGLLAHPDGPDRRADYFYEAPLGVDPVFHARIADRPKDPIFLVCTSGHVPETEGVLECVEAAKQVGGRVLHLGPRTESLVALGDAHVSYVEGVSDQTLAALYRNCRFVSGLRRVEGFELPAAEGLCAGAIPLLFDQPHYRRWFEEAGIYLAEVTPKEVTHTLEQIFRHPYSGQVDAADMVLAQRKFSWPRVVKGFWDRILG